LNGETFCHAGERKSPRVTEEGPKTPPKAASETVAVASNSSSSSELSSANAQKRDPPAARRSTGGNAGREDKEETPAPVPARESPLRRHRRGAWESQRSFFFGCSVQWSMRCFLLLPFFIIY
jgi:hypothetical protein